MTAGKTRTAFACVTILFFVWGAVTSVNDVLIPAVKKIFVLSDTESFLTQFAFFMAYGIVSLPAAAILARQGASRSIVIALATMIVGCLLFPVATGLRAYPVVLLALFVIASGITLLQVAANPLSAVLGPPERSHLRLVLSQAFNSLGTVIGPYLAAHTLLRGGLFDGGDATEAKIAYSLARIDTAYFSIAAIIVILAVFLWQVRGHINAAVPPAQTGGSISDAFRSKWAMLGAGAIFLYVGAEVSIGSAMTNFLEQPDTFGAAAEIAGKCVAIYWFCAMIGRFVGSLLLARIRAALLLAWFAGAAALLCFAVASPAIGAVLHPVLALLPTILSPLLQWLAGIDLSAIHGPGLVIGATALSIGLFNSIMFPVIFTLTIERSSAPSSSTSGLLCMAIVGGALVPLLFAQVADATGSRFVAFFVPMACYLLIAGFAIAAARARSLIGTQATPAMAH